MRYCAIRVSCEEIFSSFYPIVILYMPTQLLWLGVFGWQSVFAAKGTAGQPSR